MWKLRSSSKNIIEKELKRFWFLEPEKIQKQ